MANEYHIKTVVLSSGERLPILLDCLGLPLFEPTIYSLTVLRARNRAANTIESTLRAIMIFYVYLDENKINIFDRLRDGELLTHWELESLVIFCRKPMKEVFPTMYRDLGSPSFPTFAYSLEAYRRRSAPSITNDVLQSTTANRLRRIRDFVAWLSSIQISKNNNKTNILESLRAAQQLVIDSINARMPSCVYGVYGREGLDPQSRDVLLQVVRPDSEHNPWTTEHAKYRNSLIINFFYYLGLRRGELLGIRISNIDYRASAVTIDRRADDPLDPRRNQPNAKTRARKIPLSAGLRDMTETYIMSYRRAQSAARMHDFLFIAESGAPMSISALNKVFKTLREKCPELAKMHPHLLRHTWNEIFSEEMDRLKETVESEKKMRAYLMGWRDSSETAATYTRRHVRQKANAISLEMQNKLWRVDE